MNQSDQSFLTILYIALIIFFCQGCGQLGKMPEANPVSSIPAESITITNTEEAAIDTDQISPEGQSGLVEKNAMVFVVDPDYNPIPNAEIGTNGRFSDLYGVFIGQVAPNDSGWLSVHAPGYVTNYAKPSPFSGDYDLYFVTLAPIDAAYYHQGSSESQLLLGDPKDPLLEVDLDQAAITDEGFLELTQINPREISMDDAWAELENPYSSIVSFDISARSMDGETINLIGGKTAVVSIPDDDHDVNESVLRSFDPENGSWIDHEGACIRSDSKTIQCVLTHFSIFNFMDKNLESWQMDSKEVTDFRSYYFSLGKMYKSGEDQGTGDEGTNQQIFDLLMKLIEAARKFAKKNPNETGKAMLIYAAQLAQSSGVEGAAEVAQELTKEAQDLTAEMAKKLEEKADCGHTDEIMHLIEQGQMLGGSAKTAADKLVDKVSDQLKNCLVWVGNIRYWFFLLDEFPELEGKWILQASNLTWNEYQTVRIGINPLTDNLSGTSIVRPVLLDASYMAEIGSGSCGVDRHFMDVNANPGTGSTILKFDGRYEDQTWSIGPLEEGESTPAIIFLHQHGLFGCPKQSMELSNTQMFTYRSQLLHGFFGVPQPPNLEEMLNNGTYTRSAEGFEIIRGAEYISYSSGVNRAPIIPVNRASLTWRFQRIPTAAGSQ